MSITVYDYDSKQSLEDLVIMNQSKNQEKCYKFDLTFFNKHEHKDESLLGPIDGIRVYVWNYLIITLHLKVY